MFSVQYRVTFVPTYGLVELVKEFKCRHDFDQCY